MERGRIQGLPKFFWVPPIISGTGRATNFNFCTHILRIDRNKCPLQISGKVAGCVVRTLKTFQGTHILGASRGLLCDSSAVLFISGLHTTLFCFEYTFWLDLRLEITLTAALPRDGDERESSVASTMSKFEWQVRGVAGEEQTTRRATGEPADYYVTAALHFPGLLNVGKRI